LSAHHRQRGATLIEALVAIAVLGVGTASVTSVISAINGARRQISFQTSSLELFNRLDSEIQSSTCLVFQDLLAPDASSADPAFLVPRRAWQITPPVGSRLRTLGDFRDAVPAVRVEYQLDDVAAAGPNRPPALDILVRVREIRGTAEDLLDIQSAHYIRTWPIRKACTFRSASESRGGYP